MIGITSYGAYLPKLRLDRMAIFQAMGWFAPATMMVAQGERSMCNWDEDAVTMAVAAARDCLTGVDRHKLDGLFLASTTLPFADRQNAGIVSAALNMHSRILTSDFTSSQRAGTSALITALESVKSGEREAILVAAADKRETKAGYFHEMWFGDGAAAFTVGTSDVIAAYRGSFSVSHDFIDHYRGSGKRFDYAWEERW
ncbi:MAG: short-chain dehydrogenase, partial [Deltaproteobacteria bacterium]